MPHFCDLSEPYAVALAIAQQIKQLNINPANSFYRFHNCVTVYGTKIIYVLDYNFDYRKGIVPSLTIINIDDEEFSKSILNNLLTLNIDIIFTIDYNTRMTHINTDNTVNLILIYSTIHFNMNGKILKITGYLVNNNSKSIINCNNYLDAIIFDKWDKMNICSQMDQWIKN